MAGFRPNHKEPQIKELPLYRQYPTEGLRIASFAAQFEIYTRIDPEPYLYHDESEPYATRWGVVTRKGVQNANVTCRQQQHVSSYHADPHCILYMT
jgi:hypothetical protein